MCLWYTQHTTGAIYISRETSRLFSASAAMQIKLGALSSDARKFSWAARQRSGKCVNARRSWHGFLSFSLARSRLGKSRLVAIWEISSAHALTQLDIPACIKTRHAECVLEMKLYYKKGRLWPAFGPERRRSCCAWSGLVCYAECTQPGSLGNSPLLHRQAGSLHLISYTFNSVVPFYQTLQIHKSDALILLLYLITYDSFLRGKNTLLRKLIVKIEHTQF